MTHISETPLTSQLSREESIDKIRAGLRSGQQQMANWQGGPLAVSAVPGAGKSTGMAAAAAITIAREQLHARRQLIVVTFTRAAAANIKDKIGKNLKELGLPKAGFMVQTLHGLALNIASRYPELSGLNLDTATLITPTQNNRIIRACVEQWISANPGRYQRLLQGNQFDGEETERLRRQSVLRTEVLPNLATTVIKEAKSSGQLPEDLEKLSRQTPNEYDILAIAADLYKNYQDLLQLRDLIDYDDMILAALRVLENESACRSLQNQIFAVFEDEAQDSSPLQTKLLEILATQPASPDNFSAKNLVRVGDPNQAINSTFTPADPIYFRQFCAELSEQKRLVEMDQAGRSAPIIIKAANFVLDWVNRSKLAGTEKPFQFQTIKPVPLGDPQANPEPENLGLEIHTPRDIYDTVQLIAERTIDLCEKDPDCSAAVLVRENKQGEWLASEIKRSYQEKLRVYEVSQEERRSHVPLEMLALLQFLERPHSPDFLKAALRVLVNRKLIDSQDLDALASMPEEFLYPGPLETPQKKSVIKARWLCCSLLRSRMELPIYNLIPFLALSLKYNQSELATADKLAERIAQQTAGEKSLTSTIMALSEIVSAEKFEPVETENMESLYTKKGQLTIITMHKAKGLDWDYVFLPFLHAQTIPGSLRVLPAANFLGEFTLAEVARAQIRSALHGETIPDIREAWEKAGYLKTAEEFRLLYVAMTRGKRLLWISAEQKAPFTWNKPQNMQQQNPCLVVPELKKQFPQAVETLPRTVVLGF
ncbi:ATP-dependent helicase [Ancylothrix sp. C2]|uniref:ATP-dependent helicase n=1 Tax=Ancylothrix sp. D3o TaxID=2953691 RepID=UPI0021BB5DF4|nr:ATP-dependent helicase [Ancylothrix sp. D3o]MCT7948933.1 ATP-dependent helicase [Ancylothrix sp. D3o]